MAASKPVPISFARRWITIADLLVAWTRLLAVVTLLLVGIAFWQQLVVVVAVAAGLFVLRENLLELIPAIRPKRNQAG